MTYANPHYNRLYAAPLAVQLAAHQALAAALASGKTPRTLGDLAALHTRAHYHLRVNAHPSAKTVLNNLLRAATVNALADSRTVREQQQCANT